MKSKLFEYNFGVYVHLIKFRNNFTQMTFPLLDTNLDFPQNSTSLFIQQNFNFLKNE